MIVTEFTIRNRTDAPTEFVLEPWADQYVVQPRHALRVVVHSPSAVRLEWEVTDGIHILSVDGPTGTDASVYDGEIEVRGR
jgi:hypothetical protein